MSGRGAFEPADRGTSPVNEKLSGQVGASAPEHPAQGPRPNWVAERWRRFAAAVSAAFRVVVAWCVGSSWDRGDPATSYPKPAWAIGAPMPAPGMAPEPDGRRLVREVRRLLAGLGPTPGDVAAALQTLGVHGVPCRPECSPVAAFLMAVVGADPDVEALGLRSDAVSLSMRGYRSPLTVPFPAAVRGFVSAFDAQCYPMLLGETREHRPER